MPHLEGDAAVVFVFGGAAVKRGHVAGEVGLARLVVGGDPVGGDGAPFVGCVAGFIRWGIRRCIHWAIRGIRTRVRYSSCIVYEWRMVGVCEQGWVAVRRQGAQEGREVWGDVPCVVFGLTVEESSVVGKSFGVPFADFVSLAGADLVNDFGFGGHKDLR